MQSVWLGTTQDEERERLKEYIKSNKKLLDILQEILYNMYREVETSSYDYDCPSWSYKQAHVNGQKQVINKIIKLCEV